MYRPKVQKANMGALRVAGTHFGGIYPDLYMELSTNGKDGVNPAYYMQERSSAVESLREHPSEEQIWTVMTWQQCKRKGVRCDREVCS